jgi:putative flippase GtrA
LKKFRTQLSSVKLNKNFIKWFTVGISSFMIDVVLFSLAYHRTEQVLLSNFLSALCSTVFNYLAHYFWTFNSVTDHRKTLTRYGLNVIFLWITSSLLIKVFLILGITGVNSKILAMCLVLPFNFFILRKYVYSRASTQ